MSSDGSILFHHINYSLTQIFHFYPGTLLENWADFRFPRKVLNKNGDFFIQDRKHRANALFCAFLYVIFFEVKCVLVDFVCKISIFLGGKGNFSQPCKA